MLTIWKLFLALHYFLYAVPLRILGGGPRFMRTAWLSPIFWQLQLHLEGAYWMVGCSAPIAGSPPQNYRPPPLRWFFGFGWDRG